MKKYLVIPAFLVFISCTAEPKQADNSNATTVAANTEVAAADSGTDTLANAVLTGAGKEDKKAVKVDTFCYIATTEDNSSINAVRFVIAGDKVTGELKYIINGEKPAEGKLIGTIKNNIITADWTFIKDQNYYKVPVAFKISPTKAMQKPSAVNEKGGAYIPEEGDYTYEFPRANCEYFPG